MSRELANAHFKWALIGATGLTGRMVLAEALARGHRPSLIGRNRRALEALAAGEGLDVGETTLDNSQTLRAAVSGHALVVNVAGPFGRTGAPVALAALASGADYIDLNGELPELERLLGEGEAAKAAGRVFVGGAGFGVAATDGLALRVSESLGGAEQLRLAVASDSAFGSPAVVESTLAVLEGGGFEYECGRLQRRAIARRRWREATPEGGSIAFASAPLAELAAVRRLTPAGRIIAGVPMPAPQAVALSTLAPALPFLLQFSPVRRAMAAASGHASANAAKSEFRSRVFVQGRRGDRVVSARLEAGEGYALAAEIAVLAVEALIDQRPTPGAYTPAGAFGARFIERARGVRVELE